MDRNDWAMNEDHKKWISNSWIKGLTKIFEEIGYSPIYKNEDVLSFDNGEGSTILFWKTDKTFAKINPEGDIDFITMKELEVINQAIKKYFNW